MKFICRCRLREYSQEGKAGAEFYARSITAQSSKDFEKAILRILDEMANRIKYEQLNDYRYGGIVVEKEDGSSSNPLCNMSQLESQDLLVNTYRQTLASSIAQTISFPQPML